MVWLLIAAGFFGLIVLVVLFFVIIFNGLVVSRNRIDNAWSQIDVQLKKRFDLIPNLVESVKAYMKHERGTLDQLTQARTQWQNAKNLQEKAVATDLLTGALKSLFAVAENYPNLRASETFLLLQQDISSIENKIAYARQFYNDAVLSYNNSIHTIPSNIVAMLLNFKEKDYFEIQEQEKETVKVGELFKK